MPTRTVSGINVSTASHRLRKELLYRYAQKAGDDICFKCENRIETVEEFSIEHKLPWEGRDDKLFWDLNNIAFSHLKCNRPHRSPRPAIMKQYVNHPRHNCPEGQMWCSSHKQYFSVDNFYPAKNYWSGYHNNCKQCHNKIRNDRRVRQKF